MKRTSIRIVFASILLVAPLAASAHTDYSEGGSGHWLDDVRVAPAKPSSPALREKLRDGYGADAVQKSYDLKDGSTLHVFADGKMAMEDRYGRPFSMDQGHTMETADGNRIAMQGNEVWRLDSLLHSNHRGR
ncbi:CopK family periplasmic copper-binding protein [Aromatoleum toluclasticum]|uniref:CopK family periplasmic copper-binding protein n=1 Tax=Aromatoleum toluclasticum TaxID=92003 RepID=UPI0003817114|nr:CopK family periplasmic copper-binding protein [Aromatoleum toluclasticum]MCC4115709.1 CopK family periplasmic copper-binding protein [Aromatoleum toluclasticum]